MRRSKKGVKITKNTIFGKDMRIDYLNEEVTMTLKRYRTMKQHNEDLTAAVEAYQRTNEKINEANKVLSQANQEMSEKYKALIESIKRGTAHRVLS